MFDKISSSITYLLMVGNRVDPSGNNITGMQITKQALKTGIDEYRFVCFDVDDNGKIDFDSNNYITVSEDMENIANMFLKQRKDIVLSSFLTDSQKKRIICC